MLGYEKNGLLNISARLLYYDIITRSERFLDLALSLLAQHAPPIRCPRRAM